MTDNPFLIYESTYRFAPADRDRLRSALFAQVGRAMVASDPSLAPVWETAASGFAALGVDLRAHRMNDFHLAKKRFHLLDVAHLCRGLPVSPPLVAAFAQLRPLEYYDMSCFVALMMSRRSGLRCRPSVTSAGARLAVADALGVPAAVCAAEGLPLGTPLVGPKRLFVPETRLGALGRTRFVFDLAFDLPPEGLAEPGLLLLCQAGYIEAALPGVSMLDLLTSRRPDPVLMEPGPGAEASGLARLRALALGEGPGGLRIPGLGGDAGGTRLLGHPDDWSLFAVLRVLNMACQGHRLPAGRENDPVGPSTAGYYDTLGQPSVGLADDDIAWDCAAHLVFARRSRASMAAQIGARARTDPGFDAAASSRPRRSFRPGDPLTGSDGGLRACARHIDPLEIVLDDVVYRLSDPSPRVVGICSSPAGSFEPDGPYAPFIRDTVRLADGTIRD